MYTHEKTRTAAESHHPNMQQSTLNTASIGNAKLISEQGNEINTQKKRFLNFIHQWSVTPKNNSRLRLFSDKIAPFSFTKS